MEKRGDSGGTTEFKSNVRFGPFELDLRGGELRKEGRRIRLQEQPFQILRMLIESPGQVISREDIRNQLWPDNTVVEFDHSINAAVKRLRDALRDSADKPRYIETVAQRGYRFIGDLTTTNEAIPAEPVAVISENGLTNRPTEPAKPYRRFRLRSRILVPLLMAIVILIVWGGARYYRRGARTSAPTLQPLMRLDLDLGHDLLPVPAQG